MSTMNSLNNIIELFREEHEGNAMIDDLPEDEEKVADDSPSADDIDQSGPEPQKVTAAAPNQIVTVTSPTATVTSQTTDGQSSASQKKKKKSKKRKRSAATMNGVESHEESKESSSASASATVAVASASTAEGLSSEPASESEPTEASTTPRRSRTRKKLKRDSSSEAADPKKPAVTTEPKSGADSSTKKKKSTPKSKKKKGAAKQQPSLDNVMATLIADLASPASQRTLFGAKDVATSSQPSTDSSKKKKKRNSLFSADEVEEFASIGSNEKVSSTPTPPKGTNEWKSLADGLLPLGKSLAEAASSGSVFASFPSPSPAMSTPSAAPVGGSSSRRKKKTPKRVAQGLGSTPAKSPQSTTRNLKAAPSSAPTAKSRKKAPAPPTPRSKTPKPKTKRVKAVPLPNPPERSALKTPGAPATPAELKKSVSFSRSIAHVREFSKKQSPSRLLSTPTTVYELPSTPSPTGGSAKKQQQNVDFAVPQPRAGRSWNRRASLRAKPRRKSTPMPQRRKSARRSTPRKINI